MTDVTGILSAIEQGDRLTIKQAAEVLGVSPRTADHYWAYAKAWLREEIDGNQPAFLTTRVEKGCLLWHNMVCTKSLCRKEETTL